MENHRLISALFALTTLWAAAAQAKVLAPGMRFSIINEPFPSALGAGVTLSVLDTLRFEATADLGIMFVGAITKRQIYNIGYGAKARIPGLKWTPVVGISVSRQFFRENSKTWGPKRVESYLTPMAGIEWHPVSTFYVGGGVTYVMGKDFGDWKPLSETSSVDFNIWPVIYLGAEF